MSGAELVVVANRLPVDGDGEGGWRASPRAGLVTALEPVMRRTHGAWVGWPGQPDLEVEPFDFGDMHLVPVSLSATMSSCTTKACRTTFWPSTTTSSRRRGTAACGGTRIRPRQPALRPGDAPAAAVTGRRCGAGLPASARAAMLRRAPARPGRRLGYFHHDSPSPAYGLCSPASVAARRGARGAARRRRRWLPARRLMPATSPAPSVGVCSYETMGVGHHGVELHRPAGPPARRLARASPPISIDASACIELARREGGEGLRRRGSGRASATRRRSSSGVEPTRLHRGIRHSQGVAGELARRRTSVTWVEDVTARPGGGPSRERVDAVTNAKVRDEIELTVSASTATTTTVGSDAIRYLHQGYPREEMVALFLAADVMLVTALRDGMNLVAKEYVASASTTAAS